jgi:membrane protein
MTDNRTKSSTRPARGIEKIIRSIDRFQQRHLITKFTYAVIKKYANDNGSYLSALITYYGLLSLFPLLIVITSLSELLLRNNAALRTRISGSIAQYIPIIGANLEHATKSPGKTGLALLISLLITFYGALGGANALQYAINTVWYIPQTKQPQFPRSLLRSIGIIIVGGVGLMAAGLMSGYTAFLGQSPLVKVLAIVLSMTVLWLTFLAVFKLAVGERKTIKAVISGALVAAVGLQVLQIGGGVILHHEIQSLSSTYGAFALVIALIFWIYLQAQVILYAAEVDVTLAYHLFPRSLAEPLTDHDQYAYAAYTKAHAIHPTEEVDVSFKPKANRQKKN